ncbi:hypothetical protein CSIM01_01138 [Colletotrichum simmondsii]|uniref:Uncharacterized protein n=1 Tax=Colletotrichum simmondsii TaxID=703756 RepID=A0A135TA68_9PEZI|nr:hypothetical protein CSIM01_01138 [Colletotrichum simmondsii]
MPSLLSVLEHNASLSARKAGFVAVFAGATSGIGLATLKVLTVSLVSPRFYVIGRSKANFAPQIAALRRSNPSASIHFIETEIALLRNVSAVCEDIVRREPHVDLLYRLDICFALSHYIRIRLIQGLLSSLLRANEPRIVSVLAGGHEKPLFTEGGDLGLRLRGNYTAPRAVDQVTTIHSLALMFLAKAHPRISFLHVYPGWVSTSFLSNLLGSGGVLGKMVATVVGPLYRMVAMSEDECGQRQAFNATSERYPSRDMILRAKINVNDQALCHGPCSGFYLVLADGSTSSRNEVLETLTCDDGWMQKVMDYTENVIVEAGGR